jgi:hypothetical protein
VVTLANAGSNRSMMVRTASNTRVTAGHDEQRDRLPRWCSKRVKVTPQHQILGSALGQIRLAWGGEAARALLFNPGTHQTTPSGHPQLCLANIPELMATSAGSSNLTCPMLITICTSSSPDSLQPFLS